MSRLYRAVRAEKPDVLVVEWVPHLYGHRGITISLPLTLAFLAMRGTKITLMVHEAWVGFDSVPLIVVGIVQRFALAVLVRSSQKVGVSIEAWTTMLRHWFPKYRNITSLYVRTFGQGL